MSVEHLLSRKYRAEVELALLNRIQAEYHKALKPGNIISPAELALSQYCSVLRSEAEQELTRSSSVLGGAA